MANINYNGALIGSDGSIEVTKIIDCAGSCGTAGQVLSSTGGTALEWITVGGGGGGSPATPLVEGIVFGCTASANGNAALGANSFLAAVAPTNTTILGNCALPAAVTTADNIVVGYKSLLAATNPTCNIVIGNCALASQTTGAIFNVVIGHCALQNGTGNSDVIAIGHSSLKSLTDGYETIAIGTNTLMCATGVGVCNVAVGPYSQVLLTDGSDNVSLGAASLNGVTTGNFNIGIGSRAGSSFSTGCNNIAIGYCSAVGTNSGNYNVVLGHCLPAPVSVAGSCQLAIGWCDGTSANYWLTGCSSKAIKPGAGIVDCAGSCGTAGQVLMSNGSNAICWGTAGGGGSPATPTVEGTVYGYSDSVDFNTSIGYSAQATNLGSSNTSFGYKAGCCMLAASCDNVAIGVEAMGASPTGNAASCNVAIGTYALRVTDYGYYNVAVGSFAMQDTTFGTDNVAVGALSLKSNTEGTYNVALGSFALFCNTLGNNNVAIGAVSMQMATTGNCNVAIGNWSLRCNTTGCFNVAVGDCALLCTTGSCSVAVGAKALRLSTGSFNTAIGTLAGQNLSTASNNTAIGFCALTTQTANNNHTAIGSCALGLANISAGNNTAVGVAAGYNSQSNQNVYVGVCAGCAATTGGNNTFIGAGAGSNVTTGGENTILGPYGGFTTMCQNLVLQAGCQMKLCLTNCNAMVIGSSGFGQAGQVLTSNGSSAAVSWSFLPIRSIAAATTISTASCTILSVGWGTVRAIFLDIAVSDATGGKYWTDTYQIVNNGVTTALTQIAGARIGTSPYTLTAPISGANINITVNSTTSNSTKYVANYCTLGT